MAAELATSVTADVGDRLLQAEAVVREFCRWHIAPTRTVEDSVVAIPDGAGALRLFLPTLHLIEVTAVVTDDEDIVPLEEVSWTRSGIVWRDGGWGSARTLTVSYSHGHPTTPPDVEAVVQAIATRGVANPGSLVRTQAGPFADTYSQTGFNQSLPIALLDAEKEILRAHRLVNLR